MKTQLHRTGRTAGWRRAAWATKGSALLASALLVAGCANASQGRAPSAAGGGAGGRPAGSRLAPPRVSAPPSAPSVEAAEREAHDLGPVAARMGMSVTLTLRGRDSAALQALLARGGRVSPAGWAGSYGPSPSLVGQLRRELSRAGISSQWQPGAMSLSATAPAATIERFFHVAVDNFALADGTRFYAPLQQPTAPRAIAGDVVAVTGMDNYRRFLTAAIAGPNGVTPSQMTSFYDMTPLRNAGIDGSGITVIFPEWGVPGSDVLAAFASKFGLPAFNVTVNSDPSAWGQPVEPGQNGYSEVAGEAALDLEVVHGLAPGAREIVYEAGDTSKLPAMLQAMVAAHPGSILSSSVFISACELEQGAKPATMAEDAVFTQAASEGTSIFWASGDRGAYACIADGQQSTLGTISIEPDASSPHVTAVGGTTVFLASNGAYYKEAAWGEPLEQWGGGGGVSTFFPRPSWQQAPGVGSITGRGDPDVSANADIESGWDIIGPAQSQGGSPVEGPVGGTSAATPCWAAVTALIDQYLTQQHLRTVGFADPALYLFAQAPTGLPATAFHQVTEGTNLHFAATPGWNPATGLGSPDVAHLADDFAWYDKTHG